MLEPGTKLGAFEVVGPLGEGGMGAVYRARDARLERDVALKVVSREVADDPERRRRFEREARVLASLSHPHVGAIYGVEHDGGREVLVLELIEGPTLAERLAQGPLPVREALELAHQIADGLEAAHERGVVHRDLKPANVCLTAEGTAKVVDFGLAKPVGTRAEGSSTGATPDSFVATSEGVVLGTPTYMSPEQARGRPVDRRTDVWAFGCVLFEMLAGRKAFGGETVGDVFAAILEHEPDLGALPPATPPRVRELVARCLVKDPRHRLRDAGDARLELARALAGDGGAPAGEAAVAGTRRASPWPWAVLALAVALGAWGWLRRPAVEPAPRPVTRFRIDAAWDGEGDAKLARLVSLAVSPDGGSVAYSLAVPGAGRIHLRALDALEPAVLADHFGSNLRFAPDGRWIGYARGDRIEKVSVGGGSPVVLGALSPVPGFDWLGPERFVLERAWGAPLATWTPGEEPEDLVSLDTAAGERGHVWPTRVGDTSVVVYAVWTGRDWTEARIAAIDLDERAPWVLVEGGTDPRFVELEGGGALVWARGDELWAARWDGRSRSLAGEPVPVLEGVRLHPHSGAAVYDVARDGTLVYEPGGAGIQDGLRLVGIDRGGERRPLLDETLAVDSASLSADGRTLALALEGSVYRLATIDVSSEPLEVRPLSTGGDSFAPCLAPDGHSIVYTSNAAGDYRLYRLDLGGAGAPRELVRDVLRARAFTPDGRTLLLTREGTEGIFALDLAERGEPRTVVPPGAPSLHPAVSPDGRWLAYASRETGDWQVVVVPFADDSADSGSSGGGRARQVSRDEGWRPLWSHDGRELVYANEESVFAAPFDPATGAIGTPVALFDSAGLDRGLLSLLPDGRLLGFEYEVREEPLSFVVVRNWTAELGERLP